MVLGMVLLHTFDQDVVGTYRISKRRDEKFRGQRFCSVRQEKTIRGKGLLVGIGTDCSSAFTEDGESKSAHRELLYKQERLLTDNC